MTIKEHQSSTSLQSTSSNWVITAAKWSIIMLASVVLAVLVWSLPRGFDITDEAFYLLNYRYPAEYEASFTDFHLVITRVFGLADASIGTYRVAALLGIGLGAVAFGLSLSVWLRRALSPDNPRRWLVRPVLVITYVLLGELLAMSIMPRTVSYNGLNTLLLLLSAAAALAALSRGPAGSSWLLLAGAAIGLDVFVKVSTAGLLLASVVVLLGWCWRKAGGVFLLRALAMLVLGIGCGTGIYFLLAQPPTVWWHTFSQELTMLQGQGYGTADLFVKYLGSAREILRVLVWPLGPVLVLVPGLAWWWLRPRQSPRWLLLLAIALLGAAGFWLAVQAVHRLWYSTAYINGLQSLAVLIFFLLLVAGVTAVEVLPADAADSSRSTNAKLAGQQLPVALWLALLPLLAAAGTYNDLRVNLVIDAAPWFGLALMLLALPRPNLLPVWVTPLLLLLPAGYAAEQTVWGTMRVPYCLTGPMTVQTQPLRAAGVRGTLLLDPKSVAFIRQLEKTLAQGGFKPGDPLLAFYDMPGLVYLCGGVSPGATWYFGGIDARNCHALDITRQSLVRACILLNEPLGPKMQRCLREHGLRFPEGYRLVGEVPSAWAINTYVYHSQQRTVRVYTPVVGL